jgi:hypothetical protein
MTENPRMTHDKRRDRLVAKTSSAATTTPVSTVTLRAMP